MDPEKAKALAEKRQKKRDEKAKAKQKDVKTELTKEDDLATDVIK